MRKCESAFWSTLLVHFYSTASPAILSNHTKGDGKNTNFNDYLLFTQICFARTGVRFRRAMLFVFDRESDDAG